MNDTEILGMKKSNIKPGDVVTIGTHEGVGIVTHLCADVDVESGMVDVQYPDGKVHVHLSSLTKKRGKKKYNFAVEEVE